MSIEGFEEKFRQAFGREMTPDERRYFQLSGMVLDRSEEDESDAAASA
jgi:hypothetical protein